MAIAQEASTHSHRHVRPPMAEVPVTRCDELQLAFAHQTRHERASETWLPAQRAGPVGERPNRRFSHRLRSVIMIRCV